MQAISPDLIVTQDLCQVCAPSGNEVTQLLTLLPSKPQILWLTPKSIEQIFENVRDLGEATDVRHEAETLIAAGRARLEKIAALTRKASSRPRVFCMEWIDPIYCCGHWVPEMVEIAGGVDKLGRKGTDSVRLHWDVVVQWKPEVIVVMPCGFGLEKAVDQAQQLFAYPDWADIPAVRENRVYVVDANAYFARPGPRIVEGTELLAHLFHPDQFNWNGPPGAFRTLKRESAVNE
jgi:iron complex transport system substrate-binding protein